MSGPLAAFWPGWAAGLFTLGVLLGAAANCAVARLRFSPPPIDPWRGPSAGQPPQPWQHRLPIAGWILLARTPGVATAAWLRPLLVELASGLLVASWYWWVVDQRGLLPPEIRGVPIGLAFSGHAIWLTHVVLLMLMLVASLVDIDDQYIPDLITVPGTLLALTTAALWPQSLLPVVIELPLSIDFLRLSSPGGWPSMLAPRPHAGSLLLVCGLLLAWCAALLPRRWYGRHGWRRAVGLCLARIARDRLSWVMGLVALAGCGATLALWWQGGASWQSYVSAVVGLAASGGVVWAVRLIGSFALRREALGFGDVTLMAMIGAFLGWQAALIVFFLAPLCGLVVALTLLVARRETVIPYGPFLCLATVVVMARWAALWEWARPLFALRGLVPLVMLGCLALMGLMLVGWRLVLDVVARRSSRPSSDGGA